MDTNPVLSIAVLTYNHEKYIRECLDGILMQKIDVPYEIVIADDCSTDNNRAIIEEYRRKHADVIRTVYQPSNVGMHENFYHLMNALKGRYFALVEGDDYWTDPRKISIQLDILNNMPEVVCCFHTAHVMKEKGSKNKLTLKRYPHKPVPQITDIEYMLEHGNYIPTASMLQRNIFKGNYPDIIADKKVLPDTMFNLLQASQGKYFYIDREMSVYRINVDGVTENRLSIIEFLAKVHMYEVSDEYTLGKWHAQHRAAIQKYYYYILDHYIKEGNKKEIAKYLKLIRQNKFFDANYHPNFIRKVWIETFIPGVKQIFRILAK